MALYCISYRAFEFLREGLWRRLLPFDKVLDVVDQVFAVFGDGRNEPEDSGAVSQLILNEICFFS